MRKLKTKKKKILSTLVLGIALLILIPRKVTASDITKETNILINEKAISSKVTDGKESTYLAIKQDTSITIKSEQDIHGIYIVYEYSSKTGTLTGNGKTVEVGQNNFLHEYINVNESIGPAKELELTYNEDVKIAEIYVLSEGELPDKR